MAQTRQCSAKEILARVIRNTGGKISSAYYDDILEWIPEAIDQLSGTRTLQITSTGNDDCPEEMEVINHQLCIPKDLVTLITIEDQYGRIIPEGGDITDLRSTTIPQRTQPNDSRVTVFSVNPLTHQTSDGAETSEPGTSIPIYGEDLTASISANSTLNYYKISGNYIQFSFETGYVKLHYLRRPLDKEGYPLIPDNENFKSACGWYVLSCLIAAGFVHPVFSYDDCYMKFELFGGRAIGEISYPSLDSVARLNRSFVRLIPPQFYEDFFVGSEQVQQIRK